MTTNNAPTGVRPRNASVSHERRARDNSAGQAVAKHPRHIEADELDASAFGELLRYARCGMEPCHRVRYPRRSRTRIFGRP
jgi:hypothetical protein